MNISFASGTFSLTNNQDPNQLIPINTNISNQISKENCFKTERMQSFSSPSTEYNEELSESAERFNTYNEQKQTSKFAAEIDGLEPLIEKKNEQYYRIEEDAISTDVSRKTSIESCALEAEEEEEDDAKESDNDEWSERKDNLLKDLAMKCKHDWKKIAKIFNNAEKTNMTPVALKQKFRKSNKGEIALRIKFSHQEDLKIVKYFELYGCNWVQIASHFSDRTPIMLKNRYYSHIRKRNLLSTMMEEVKDIHPEVNDMLSVTRTPSFADNTIENNTVENNDDGNLGLIFQNTNGLFLRKLSMRSFDNSYFEMENLLTTTLHERITLNDL